jgi:hypothetical protein
MRQPVLLLRRMLRRLLLPTLLRRQMLRPMLPQMLLRLPRHLLLPML